MPGVSPRTAVPLTWSPSGFPALRAVISQRELNLAVYLSDDGGRRYDPVQNQSDVPFNVLLGPQESAVARRVFDFPSDAHPNGVVIKHEGGFPIGWFIIGYETWFRKPAIVRLS